MWALPQRESLRVGQQGQHALPGGCRVEQQQASHPEPRCRVTFLLRGEHLDGDTVAVVHHRGEPLDDAVVDPQLKGCRHVAKSPLPQILLLDRCRSSLHGLADLRSQLPLQRCQLLALPHSFATAVLHPERDPEVIRHARPVPRVGGDADAGETAKGAP